MRQSTRIGLNPLVLTAVCALSLGCSNPAGDSSGNAGGAGSDVASNFGDVVDLPDGASADVSGSDGGGLAGYDGVTGPCTDGQRGCKSAKWAAVCVGGEWKLDDICNAPKQCVEGFCTVPATCKPGENGGCDGYDTRSVCAKSGKAWLPIPCPTGELCVQGVCKKTACVPGVKVCDGQQYIKTCKADGSGYGEKENCTTGAYCLGGKCVSLCEQNLKVASNIGCEYWSADLDNYDDPSPLSNNPKFVPHSVVISNPGLFDATITFEAKPPWKINVPNNIVKAGHSVEFKMPVMNVDGNEIAAKAIHVKSTQPVVAYQFNPFNADKAHSNDGSLLLPHNALGKEYIALTRPSGPETGEIIPGGPVFEPQKGYFTVLATRGGTTKVQVTISGQGYVKKAPGTGLPLKPYQTVTYSLKQYDVLNLEAHSTLSGIRTMTGTYIKADKEVAVFGGHEELVLGYKGGPQDNCCAEHVEEQLLPLNAWGSDALCVKTSPRGKEKDIWVVQAGAAGVEIKTDPSIKGLDGKKFSSQGQWVEVHTDKSFTIKATGKIQVGQFIVSQEQTDDWIGDPTFIIHAPQDQLRKDYFILTPKGYSKNWATVVRPKGAKITMDGTAIPDASFVKIGTGTWEYAYVKMSVGEHKLEGDQAFELSVYGYGNTTAYGYPGGMNLK